VAFLYFGFGLHLHSNQPIPGLVALATTSRIPDVQIWLDLAPPWLNGLEAVRSQLCYVSAYQNEQGLPLLTIQQWMGGDYFQLTYGDRTEFIVDRAGTQIWVTWPDTLTVEDTATYLLGPILGFVLRLRGVVCLHASAIAVGDQCMAIVGPAGAGKSTTAAAFAKAGFPVLSDDVVALVDRERRFLVQPAYPRVRLWPESVTALYGKPDALPCLTPNWDKRYLDLTQTGYEFHGSPLPLGAVYILGDRANSPAAPLMETIPAHKSLITLVTNTYGNGLLEKAMRAQEFDLLSRLVANVLIRRVIPHTDSAYLSKLCKVILEDFQEIGNGR
jgi:hypothetical protein